MRKEIPLLLATAGLILGACAPVDASPTQTFEPTTVFGNDWKAVREGSHVFQIYDERGGILTGSQRQGFLHGVLQTLQDDYGCVITEDEVVTNGSRRIAVEDPDCILQIINENNSPN